MRMNLLRAAVLAATCLMAQGAAQAQLFGDDQARQAIGSPGKTAQRLSVMRRASR